LRVWERRYGVLAPERTSGGQRLYSVADEQRIRAMRAHLASGAQAAEAARLVTQSGGQAASARELGQPLVAALDALDEAAAHAALDRVFAELGVETTLTDVVMPYLHELGDRWARAEVTPAEEHFASRLLHARLLGAARGWDSGSGPRALLACPPGEEHDLALISYGIALGRLGWRITFLGASTPIGAIGEMAAQMRVDVVVLAATTPVRFAEVIEPVRKLAGEVPVALAGAGANARLAAQAGARLLDGDPVAAAVATAAAVASA
jgi:DNA-binding transcriptional MerR regulator